MDGEAGRRIYAGLMSVCLAVHIASLISGAVFKGTIWKSPVVAAPSLFADKSADRIPTQGHHKVTIRSGQNCPDFCLQH
jgi:hypothetical protein